MARCPRCGGSKLPPKKAMRLMRFLQEINFKRIHSQTCGRGRSGISGLSQRSDEGANSTENNSTGFGERDAKLTNFLRQGILQGVDSLPGNRGNGVKGKLLSLGHRLQLLQLV